ncbi:MAG: hypothetical protein J0I23_17675 [Rhizobiales bacterium]|nr:hypothetical protein [Hyphomicrobiales bacterium]
MISVTFAVEPDGGVYTAVGRCAWALKELIRCQDKGITSIENPAPRLAAYVFKLKKLYGLVIETVDEKHGGPYSGCHGRYFLRSQVKVLRETEALS